MILPSSSKGFSRRVVSFLGAVFSAVSAKSCSVYSSSLVSEASLPSLTFPTPGMYRLPGSFLPEVNFSVLTSASPLPRLTVFISLFLFPLFLSLAVSALALPFDEIFSPFLEKDTSIVPIRLRGKRRTPYFTLCTGFSSASSTVSSYRSCSLLSMARRLLKSSILLLIFLKTAMINGFPVIRTNSMSKSAISISTDATFPTKGHRIFTKIPPSSPPYVVSSPS